MPNTIEKTRPEDRFASAFEMHEGHTLNGSNARLQGLRKEAFARFADLGFPTTKHEAWRYTNIARALSHDYQLRLRPDAPALSAADLAPLRIPGLDAYLAVLVDGRFAADLSELDGLPEGVVVAGLAEANERHTELLNRHLGRYAPHGDEAFAALNTAFTQDGLFVYLPRNAVLDRPVHVVQILRADEDVFVQPRNLFVFEQGSQARFVETGESLTEAKTFTNAVDEVYVGPGANVRWYKVQREGAKASQVSGTHVYQERDSAFFLHTVTLGGALVRNNVSVLPDGENCETHLFGLFLPRGDEHVDNNTFVDHARPNCYSHELYKGVLDDRSTGVFNGKVFVRQDAQKINAFQENNALVLSPDARMFSKPELEIYADDVKCSHGATSGQLDPDAMFYLRQRGLSRRQAQAVLLLAFARDVLDSIAIEPLRAWVDAQVAERFHD